MTSLGNTFVELKYRPLRADHPLALLEDACLPMRAPRYVTCRACESVCPVKAIRVGETAIALAEKSVQGTGVFEQKWLKQRADKRVFSFQHPSLRVYSR